MRNRAKCKQCGDILESFHETDLVYCKCNEIAISGGNNHYYCWAENYKNFLRIDDDDNEIEVKYMERNTDQNKDPDKLVPPSENKSYDINHLDVITDMIRVIEELPNHAKIAPCTQYDFLSLLYVVSSWMKYKK